MLSKLSQMLTGRARRPSGQCPGSRGRKRPFDLESRDQLLAPALVAQDASDRDAQRRRAGRTCRRCTCVGQHEVVAEVGRVERPRDEMIDMHRASPCAAIEAPALLQGKEHIPDARQRNAVVPEEERLQSSGSGRSRRRCGVVANLPQPPVARERAQERGELSQAVREPGFKRIAPSTTTSSYRNGIRWPLRSNCSRKNGIARMISLMNPDLRHATAAAGGRRPGQEFRAAAPRRG